MKKTTNILMALMAALVSTGVSAGYTVIGEPQEPPCECEKAQAVKAAPVASQAIPAITPEVKTVKAIEKIDPSLVSSPRILVKGAAPSNMPVLKGFANNTPLLIVLKQITPAGWKAAKIGEVNLDKKVSWKGGKNWIETLAVLAKNNNFSAEVDFDKKELTVVGVEVVKKEVKPVVKKVIKKEVVKPVEKVSATSPTSTTQKEIKVDDAMMGVAK